jgi:hypothetical protein
MLKKIFSTMMIVFFCAGVASAADQLRTRDTIKTPTKLKDGSCRMLENDSRENPMIAAAQNRNCNQKGTLNRNQNRNQLKTGTLTSSVSYENGSILLAADRLRDRDTSQEKDQLKDGSCEN